MLSSSSKNKLLADTNDEKIEGIVNHIKYYDENKNFYILNINTSKEKNKSIKGVGEKIKQNDCISATGSWETTKYGKQFNAAHIQVIKATKKETILEYLCSGIIKGLGKKNAKLIVDTYGDKSLDILDEKPDLLLRIDGIGQKKLQKIINSWDEVRPSEQTVLELINLGYQNFEAVGVYKKFGSDSLNIAKTKPYILHKRVHSLSFEKVDQVALENGFPRNNTERISAAIEHFLKEEHRSGDCLIEYNFLYKKVRSYLRVDDDAIMNEINNGIRNGLFYYIESDGSFYLQYRTVTNAEEEIARRVFLIYKNKNHKKNSDIIYDIKDLSRKGEKKVSFSVDQRNAIHQSINEKINIITGKPGAGKTTVLNEILKQLRNLNKTVLLCAPTGKAAQKMTESTGFPSATIHRLLEFLPMENGFQKNEDDPLDADVIVIDENSMIDVFLMSNLLKAVSDNTQVIFIGDVDQLASVQCGAVLRDMINSQKLPVSRLEKIFRQSSASKIITTAHAINDGNFDYETPSEKTDFYYINSSSDEKTLENIKKITGKLKSTFDINPMNGLQLLAPQHEGVLGTKNLNKEMQSLLNTEDTLSISRNNFNYKEGDRIIQIHNNYDKNVFNGDSGRIIILNYKGIVVKFDNDLEVEYELNELNEILPSYCITIHKSQGSEYPAIIIALPQSYSPIIDRSLIYTGITRGKSLVVIIGNIKVLKRGIASKKSRYRKTFLKNRLEFIFDRCD